MRKFLILVLVGLIGSINFELTLASHEFPSLIPVPIYLVLAGISLFIFLSLWIEYRLTHRFQAIEILFLLMMLYPILAEVWSQDQILLSQLNASFQESSSIFTLSTMKIFQGIFYGMSVGMILYTLYFFSSAMVSTKYLYRWVLGIVIAVVLAEVLYSLVMEWEEYVFVFENFSEGARLSITSFTTNTNIYAFNLTMGVYAVGSLFMSEKNLRWIYPLLGILFSILIVFTVSKTAMLAIVLYVFVYGGMLIYRVLKKRPMLLKMTMTSLIVLMVVGYQSIWMIDHPIMERIQSLLTSSALGSFTSRVDIWIEGMTLFQNQNTFFGYGLGLSNTYLGVATAIRTGNIGQIMYQVVNDRFHNGFLEILVSYGLVGTLLLTIAHWEYMKALIAMTKRYAITIPMWALLFSFAVQMMFEDRIIFRPDLSGVFFLVLLILPLVKPSEYNRSDEAHQ
jgi:O-antigen ligase